FPPDPDLGSRSRNRLDQPLPTEPEPPPKPTWPAKFVADHRSFAQVGVYDVRWPEIPPLGREATCDVLFQVNSQRRVWAWAEACDEAIRAPVEAAASQWLLMAGERERGERYARFRGTFVVPADGGHVSLRIAEEDLVTDPKALPEYVDTFRIAHAVTTVPPKLPKSFATETLESEVTCEYDVEVDKRGRPATVTARSCPRDLGEFALKALDQWRWEPAESDGQPIASRVVVRIRFDLGVKSASG
ncbi:MAG: energy transducer TonB, partial [Myxococcota bacterium]